MFIATESISLPVNSPSRSTLHDAIKREVGMSRQLVEKGGSRDWEDEKFGTAGGAESESSTTSNHASLGRPYTPSLPNDSSDVDSLRKDSTDSNPNSLQNSKDAASIHQLETPESSIHRVPVTSVSWTDSPVPDSLASSISKGFGHENAAQTPPPFDAVSSLPFFFRSISF
jgi:hypothetical protein